MKPTNEQIEAARPRFILAAAKIEPDVRLRELTDEETNSLIEAALSHDVKPVALAHIYLEDDAIEAELEVKNGETLQPEHSPVALYTHPPDIASTAKLEAERDELLEALIKCRNREYNNAFEPDNQSEHYHYIDTLLGEPK